jgi:hypothetical protein
VTPRAVAKWAKSLEYGLGAMNGAFGAFHSSTSTPVFHSLCLLVYCENACVLWRTPVHRPRVPRERGPGGAPPYATWSVTRVAAT